MSEGHLVERAVAGDAAAFGALVRLHQSRLRAFLRRIAHGDQALADDIAQDAFLEAWRHIQKFRGEGTFAGWLTRIAFRRYLRVARQRKLETLEEAGENVVEPRHETRLDLEKAMALISLPQRAALTMCFAMGYSHEEAADILEMPLGTVKSHIARGRERLRQLLERGS